MCYNRGMPDDDLEKFRKFMVEQQAQFWADLRAMDERQTRFDAEMKEFRRETETRLRTLVDVSLSLARHGEETDRRIRELAEAHAKLAAETEYKLNALIDTVDKLVKRNGSR